jgi:hypothetical protein
VPANIVHRTRACCFSRLGAFFFSFLVFTLLLLPSAPIAAADPPPNPVVADELKQLNDQTIIGNRVSLDTGWDHFKEGAEKVTWTLAAQWAWQVSDSQDWGLRLRLPFAYHRSDQASDYAEVGGVGDAEIGAGTAFRLNDTWRTGGGIELHADTASDRALAEQVWRLKPGWGVAHDFTKWFSASFSADYNHSIAEEDGVRPHRYLELSLPATLIFPQAWSINAKYTASIDFENGDRWSHTVGAGVAKRLSKVPVVLSANLEKPLSSGAKRFQASVSIVYYFQRYHRPK